MFRRVSKWAIVYQLPIPKGMTEEAHWRKSIFDYCVVYFDQKTGAFSGLNPLFQCFNYFWSQTEKRERKQGIMYYSTQICWIKIYL